MSFVRSSSSLSMSSSSNGTSVGCSRKDGPSKKNGNADRKENRVVRIEMDEGEVLGVSLNVELVVVKVRESSIASNKLHVGDRLLKLNGKPIKDRDHFYRLLAEASPVAEFTVAPLDGESSKHSAADSGPRYLSWDKCMKKMDQKAEERKSDDKWSEDVLVEIDNMMENSDDLDVEIDDMEDESSGEASVEVDEEDFDLALSSDTSYPDGNKQTQQERAQQQQSQQVYRHRKPLQLRMLVEGEPWSTVVHVEFASKTASPDVKFLELALDNKVVWKNQQQEENKSPSEVSSPSPSSQTSDVAIQPNDGAQRTSKEEDPKSSKGANAKNVAP